MNILSLEKNSQEYKEFVKELKFVKIHEVFLNYRSFIYIHVKSGKYYKVKLSNFNSDFWFETRGDTDFLDLVEVKSIERTITITEWIENF